MLNEEFLEEGPIPRTSKTRYAKVTMYLEVPSNFDEGSLASAMDAFIEKNFDGVTTTAPGEAIVSNPGSDNPDDFQKPVGFLAPDGKFYLMEAWENGLAHLELAPLIEKIYEDVLDDRIMRASSNMGIDYALEKAGFIKVHNFDVRYLANWPVNTWDGWVDTPDPTDTQIKALVRYAKKHSFEGGWLDVNGKTVNISVIKQADELALRKIFSL